MLPILLFQLPLMIIVKEVPKYIMFRKGMHSTLSRSFWIPMKNIKRQ
jgi:hypothetical protein